MISAVIMNCTGEAFGSVDSLVKKAGNDGGPPKPAACSEEMEKLTMPASRPLAMYAAMSGLLTSRSNVNSVPDGIRSPGLRFV